jgi:cytochrome c oxidase subunit 2
LRALPGAGIVNPVKTPADPRRLVPIGVVLAAAGCAWDGQRSTLVARSDFAREILAVYGLITWAAIGIALVVSVILGWVLVRYRERPGATLPPQTRGHTLLEIGWTIAPALVLLVISVPTIQVIFRTQAPAKPGALEVVVRGFQWWWEFRYPGLDVVTANELHLPAGRPVALRLEGPDVIHSFWVPRLGGKRDVVPGRVNLITLTPETPGEYLGQCAEFCGAAHALMGLRVIVEPPAAFERWVADQKAPPVEPGGDAAAEGKAVYARSACVGCHTIRGVSAGTLGPDLTHVGSRRTLGAGLLPNRPDALVAWLRDPVRLKPGVKMPNLGLTDSEARSLAAYLLSLR